MRQGSEGSIRERIRSISLDGNQLVLSEDGNRYLINIKRTGNDWKVGCTLISSEAMDEILRFIRR